MRSSNRARVERAFCGAALSIAAAAAFVGNPAAAGETVNYTYDGVGRLVKVAHSGTVNSSTSSCYAYDHAGNRTNVTVSTTSDCTPAAASVTFSVSDVSIREGGNLTFTVTKAGTASGTTTVDYATADGTATAGSDYTAKSGTLTFLSGDTSKTVSVSTIDDPVVESDETVLLNLSNSSAGTAIARAQAVGTINDNDSDCTGVSFTISSNGPANEGSNSVFTVTKSGTTSYSCDVGYATASGTGVNGAISGSDFTATSGTLTFLAAQNSKTVSVPITDDTAMESDETFTMSLSSPDKGATLGTPSTATATISANDACQGVSFTIASNGAVTEGAGSVFTITKTGSAGGTCSVNYATANGTAVAPGDYTATSGTLSFTNLQSARTVTVPTIDNTVAESSETFSMALSNPTQSATLGTPSSATATINDNDSGGVCSGGSFAVSDASVTEGAPLVFTVTKSGTTSGSCTVGYSTADGTATAPAEYTAKTGSLTFGTAAGSQTVSVTTVDTMRAKGTHTMYLNLTTTSGGAVISDGQGIGSIGPSEAGTCTTCTQSVDPAAADQSSDTTSTTDPPPQQ